uniref:Uncharacterized protein n=1 Tax=Aegilops tauschii subsp. strangulata TaxID=200361 RepID=A0A453A235_AEGTS
AAARRSGSPGTVRAACRWSGGRRRSCADGHGAQAQAASRPPRCFVPPLFGRSRW